MANSGLLGVNVGEGAEGLEVCCGLGLGDDAGKAEKYDAEDTGVGDGLDGGGVEGALTTCCDEDLGAFKAFGLALAAA